MRTWIPILAMAALLLGGGEVIAGKGGGRPGGGGGGGGGAAAEPEIAYLVISGSDVSGTGYVTGDLWVMTADGSTHTRLVDGECGRAGWSPDLNPGATGYQGRLVFGSDVDGPGLYTIDPSGSNLTKLVATNFVPKWASWSPTATADGAHKIAFQSMLDYDADGEADLNNLFLVDTDGRNLVDVFHRTDRGESSPSWSPDASALALQMGDASGADVMVLELGLVDGQLAVTGVENLTDSGPLASGYGFHPEWSRTGRQLVVTDTSGGRGDVWIVDIDDPYNPTNLTQNYIQILNGNATPTWSPDDSEIVFASDNDLYDFGSLWLLPADGSSKTELVRRDRGKKNIARQRPSWRP